MSDENISDVQRKLTAAMQQQADDYARFGQMQVSTADKLRDAQFEAATGFKNLSAAGGLAGKAFGALAGAGVAAASAMYEGKKGMGALNSSLDSLSEAATLAGAALTLLLPGGVIMKAVIGGLTMAATAAIAYTKAANDMSDKLYKSYTGLQKAGAAASDGMTGVFRDAKKLGLSMNELDSFTSLIAENSQDLALFSGTVYEGRKKFADMSEAMEGSRVEFFKMGITQTEINEGMAGYLRTVTRTGRAQTMTTDQLASSARNYITEQDALAKITGIGVKQQQAALDKALQNEQFLAKIRQLEANGEKDKADELKKLNAYYQAIGDEAAEGFQATVNGNLRNKAAQKLNFSTQGEGLRSTQMVLSGQLKAAGAADRVYGALSDNEKNIARQQAQFGIASETGLKYSETVNGAILANGEKRVELEKKILKDQEDQKKGVDKITDGQAEQLKKQQDANKKAEKDVFKGIPAAQANMAKLSKATDVVADGFTELSDVLNSMLGGSNDKAADKAASKPKPPAAPSPAAPSPAAPPSLAASMGNEWSAGYRSTVGKLQNKGGPALPSPAGLPPAPASRSTAPSAAMPAPTPKPLAPAAPAAPAAPSAATVGGQGTAKQKTGGGTDGQGAEKTGSNNMQAPKPATLKTASKGGSSSMSDDDIKKMIIAHEGKRYEPYKDSLGLWTVGVGHLIGDGKALPPDWNRKFSEEEVMKLFDEDYNHHRLAAQKIPGFGKLGTSGQGALTDLTFNMGPSWIQKWPKLKDQLANLDLEGAASNLEGSKWYAQVKSRGPTVVDMLKNSEVTAEEGGAFSGPNSGYAATLHGDEAVIPLNNGGGNFVQLFEQMAMMMGQQAGSLDELVRIAKNGNDISTKILRSAN